MAVQPTFSIQLLGLELILLVAGCCLRIWIRYLDKLTPMQKMLVLDLLGSVSLSACVVLNTTTLHMDGSEAYLLISVFTGLSHIFLLHIEFQNTRVQGSSQNPTANPITTLIDTIALQRRPLPHVDDTRPGLYLCRAAAAVAGGVLGYRLGLVCKSLIYDTYISNAPEYQCLLYPPADSYDDVPSQLSILLLEAAGTLVACYAYTTVVSGKKLERFIGMDRANERDAGGEGACCNPMRVVGVFGFLDTYEWCFRLLITGTLSSFGYRAVQLNPALAVFMFFDCPDEAMDVLCHVTGPFIAVFMINGWLKYASCTDAHVTSSQPIRHAEQVTQSPVERQSQETFNMTSVVSRVESEPGTRAYDIAPSAVRGDEYNSMNSDTNNSCHARDGNRSSSSRSYPTNNNSCHLYAPVLPNDQNPQIMQYCTNRLQQQQQQQQMQQQMQQQQQQQPQQQPQHMMQHQQSQMQQQQGNAESQRGIDARVTKSTYNGQNQLNYIFDVPGDLAALGVRLRHSVVIEETSSKGRHSQSRDGDDNDRSSKHKGKNQNHGIERKSHTKPLHSDTSRASSYTSVDEKGRKSGSENKKRDSHKTGQSDKRSSHKSNESSEDTDNEQSRKSLKRDSRGRTSQRRSTESGKNRPSKYSSRTSSSSNENLQASKSPVRRSDTRQSTKKKNESLNNANVKLSTISLATEAFRKLFQEVLDAASHNDKPLSITPSQQQPGSEMKSSEAPTPTELSSVANSTRESVNYERTADTTSEKTMGMEGSATLTERRGIGLTAAHENEPIRRNDIGDGSEAGTISRKTTDSSLASDNTSYFSQFQRKKHLTNRSSREASNDSLLQNRLPTLPRVSAVKSRWLGVDVSNMPGVVRKNVESFTKMFLTRSK